MAHGELLARGRHHQLGPLDHVAGLLPGEPHPERDGADQDVEAATKGDVDGDVPDAGHVERHVEGLDERRNAGEGDPLATAVTAGSPPLAPARRPSRG